jgi:DNA damage-inducible protein 1
LKALIEVDSKIKLENIILKFEGKELSQNQSTIKQLGIKNNELLSLEEKKTIQPSTTSSGTNFQQNYQQQNPNPFGNLDLLKTSTKDLITYLKSNQYILSQFPPQFRQAVVSGNVEAIEQMVAPLKQKLRHEELVKRAELNPFDIEAQKYLEELIQRGNIDENMEKAFEHTPESFTKVVMLYIDSQVNNVPVKAFVDSGAQMTIMTKDCAEKCGLLRLLDTRYQGMAQGVGTAKILGKIHLTQMKIGKSFFNVSITVLEQKGIDFLLGLDMLRRHQCVLDLKSNTLQIGDEKVSFLQEKDIPEHDPVGSQNVDSSKPKSTPISGGNTLGYGSPEKLKQLMDLGFAKDQCLKALEMAKGNVELAAGILFGGGN